MEKPHKSAALRQQKRGILWTGQGESGHEKRMGRLLLFAEAIMVGGGDVFPFMPNILSMVLFWGGLTGFWWTLLYKSPFPPLIPGVIGTVIILTGAFIYHGQPSIRGHEAALEYLVATNNPAPPRIHFRCDSRQMLCKELRYFFYVEAGWQRIHIYGSPHKGIAIFHGENHDPAVTTRLLKVFREIGLDPDKIEVKPEKEFGDKDYLVVMG